MKNLNLNKDVTLMELAQKGVDLYSLLGVDRETKCLKRTTSNLAIKEEYIEENKEEVIETKPAKIIEIVPITKPSDRFDIEDYILYREYMIKHGGQPSVKDYFEAIEYYKSRA